MTRAFVRFLRCPNTGSSLSVESLIEKDGRIQEGWLTATTNPELRYPIKQFIPRFVEPGNYAASFGFQWLRHSDTQYDSVSGVNSSAKRFFEETRWPPQLKDELILEAGSGAGIFTEHAASTGATIISFDYSLAVEANYARNGKLPNVLILQADIFHMPFAPAIFDKIFCFGVLQHTPSPEKAFYQLVRGLKPGGRIAIDVYRLGLMGLTKYLVRPVTRTMAPERLYKICQAHVHCLWPVARLIRKIPKIGPYLNWLLLVADYSAWYKLEDAKLKEWAVLNTFDMLSPRYDKPQTSRKVANWFAKAGLIETDVRHGYNGIEGRGRKPR
jgi:SAM-dependent methyltransferase